MPTPAVRNNNPGNLKDPSTGTFRQFKTPQEGYAALLNDLQAKQTGTTSTGLGPDSTLIDFAATYAPKGDKNNPGQYAANLANQMGVRPDARLRELSLPKWAAAVAKNEDNSSVFGNQKILERGDVPQPESKGFFETVGRDLSKRATDFGQNVGDIPAALQGQGRQHVLSDVLQAGGAVAGGITDVIGAGLSAGFGLLPEGVRKPLEQAGGAIGEGISKVPGVQGAVSAYQQLPEETRGNIGAVGNIASLVPIGKGAGLASKGIAEAVPTATRGLAKVPGIVGDVAKGSLEKEAQQVLSVGAKEMGKTARKEAVRSGRAEVGKGGLVSIAPAARETSAAQAVAGIVRKGESAVENANRVRGAINKEATDLVSKLEKMEIQPTLQQGELSDIYQKALREVGEDPDLVLINNSDKYAQLMFRKFNEFLPKGKEITAADLLKARKEFDSWVKSREGGKIFQDASLQNLKSIVLRALRQNMNDLIASKAPDVAVKESLSKQTAMFNALERLVQKGEKEVGTTARERFLKEHPGIKGLLRLGTQATVTGLGLEGAQRLLND